ncbi:MAG TPA: imidazole glycerol phosphate synthase subunit HisH [Solirubrobacteraceae bacterium]|nr:imidazole glycerol phosphate synthase subunit HisH [Solirubrobacteraceae bacterium]
MTTVAVVDYGMGNRRSVEKALTHVGARALITRDPTALEQADALVVPGVGAFPQGMRNLVELGLDERIRAAAATGIPVLGICLGMQLLFERSQEHELTAGLGLLAGEVSPLDGDGLRIPHIGWNDVHFERPSPLTTGLPGEGCAFYHVHSLAARPDDPADVIATTEYGERFATIVGHGNVLGVQFHPEKSSRDGLTLLGSFVALASGNGGSLGRAWAGATSR